MKSGYLLAGLISPLLLLAGCGTAPSRSQPAPVVRGGPGEIPLPMEVEPSSRAVVPAPKAVVRPRRAPAPVDERSGREPVMPATLPLRTQKSPAVATLMEDARRQQQAGNLAAAAAGLERALRIEPGNAYLWNRLAHIRFRQRRLAQVPGLAARSNALAGEDEALRADNRALIERVGGAR